MKLRRIFVGDIFRLTMISGKYFKQTKIEECDDPLFAADEGMTGVMRHENISEITGVPMGSEHISLQPGDILYVAHVTGPGSILPSTKTLPIGFKIKWARIWVENLEY